MGRSRQSRRRVAVDEQPPAVETGERQRTLTAAPRALIGDAQRWSSQFGVMVRRYVRVIAADRTNASLLVLQPVILGLLMLAIDRPRPRSATSSSG